MIKLSQKHIEESNDTLEQNIVSVAADDLEELDAEIDDKDSGEDAADSNKHKAPDPRQEAATPHANAAKDLFNKRRELLKQVNMLDDQLSKHREVLRALDPKVKHEAYLDDKELRNYLKPEKVEEKKKYKKLDRKAEVEVVEGLLKVASVLDGAGDAVGLEMLENVLRIFAKKDEFPKKYDVETIEKTPREYPEVHAPAPALSTRHCPDHNGVMLKRVAEGSFQCDLDGRIYNWSQGFKDYNGNVHPGAPIRSVDFPDVNERIFENREMALSKRIK
jgi:hypothetical protein